MIAGNSTFQFNGKALDIRDVGSDLTAAHIIQGSVRQSDNRISVTAVGAKALQEAKDTGFGRELWESCDQRLQETLLVTCPHCGASNHASWFWRDKECFQREHGIMSRQIRDVRIEKAVIATRRYVRM